MPCYYTGTARGDAELSAREANKTVTQLTEMLCAMCRELEDKSGHHFIDRVPNLRYWWEQHKRIDAKSGGDA